MPFSHESSQEYARQLRLRLSSSQNYNFPLLTIDFICIQITEISGYSPGLTTVTTGVQI